MGDRKGTRERWEKRPTCGAWLEEGGAAQEGAVRSMEQMRANIDSGREVVVDARSEGRWAGREPEPRPGLPSGHIPGSRSVPFFSLLTPSKTCAPLPPALSLTLALGLPRLRGLLPYTLIALFVRLAVPWMPGRSRREHRVALMPPACTADHQCLVSCASRAEPLCTVFCIPPRAAVSLFTVLPICDAFSKLHRLSSAGLSCFLSGVAIQLKAWDFTPSTPTADGRARHSLGQSPVDPLNVARVRQAGGAVSLVKGGTLIFGSVLSEIVEIRASCIVWGVENIAILGRDALKEAFCSTAGTCQQRSCGTGLRRQECRRIPPWWPPAGPE